MNRIELDLTKDNVNMAHSQIGKDVSLKLFAKDHIQIWLTTFQALDIIETLLESLQQWTQTESHCHGELSRKDLDEELERIEVALSQYSFNKFVAENPEVIEEMKSELSSM